MVFGHRAGGFSPAILGAGIASLLLVLVGGILMLTGRTASNQVVSAHYQALLEHRAPEPPLMTFDGDRATTAFVEMTCGKPRSFAIESSGGTFSGESVVVVKVARVPSPTREKVHIAGNKITLIEVAKQ
ncbi:MAG: hypothetical protein JST40_03655 [Armatimonadetes bacterium]|nr:hypothetical protein [Armatimonadota bacterium]